MALNTVSDPYPVHGADHRVVPPPGGVRRGFRKAVGEDPDLGAPSLWKKNGRPGVKLGGGQIAEKHIPCRFIYLILLYEEHSILNLIVSI